MEVVFFGAYDPEYPRNAVLRRGLELNGVRVSECRVPPGRRFWLRYPALLGRWLRRRKHDAASASILFVPEFGHKDVPLARLLGHLTSRRVVFDPLASRYETKILDWRRKPTGSPSAWWNRVIDRRAFRFSDFIVADTRAHKEYYGREFHLEASRVAVVPVGFDDRIFSRALADFGRSVRKTDEAFTVLFFGSFLPLHGVAEIIEAARIVSDMDKSMNFRFFGSGQTLASVRARAAELRLANVGFEGWLNQAELAAAVSRTADVCLGIFGRTEKADRVVPHKVFQAMALRKPVVTARTPAIEEFFTDRENIRLCPRGDARALAEAILELKEDRALYERIAQKSYELVWTRYHPAALGACLRDILEKGLYGDSET